MSRSKSVLNFAGAAALALSFAGIANPASATITTALTPVTQQTQNAPCVIGNTSCKNGGLNDVEFSGTPGGGQGSTYTIFSPDYVVANLGAGVVAAPPNTITTSFFVGVDENISAGAGPEVLQFFDVFTCTTGCGTTTGGLVPPTTLPAGFSLNAANSFTGPFTIPNQNNGNGFSDFVLNGFSLAAGTHVIFEASVSSDTDGMEQFFLAVPAPAIGHGLLVLLAVGGVLFGSRLLEGRNKRHFHAA